MGISFKLHVVGYTTELSADEVLGRDNMWMRVIVNSCKSELIFTDDIPTRPLEKILQLRENKMSQTVIEGQTID